ncbi:MAG TPA: EcsC family protein [Steroidobacteraceae bacterium]|nr:EcsC family protein [Steroidobacteraceae bacterium]
MGATPVAARQLAAWLMQKGLAGPGPLASAKDLASEYLDDARYATTDERVDALIEHETIKNFATGFVTGLGGVITLPVSIPSALAASWLIQARMAGAIASLYGHDLAAARTQTAVLMSLAGDVAKDAMQGLGIPYGPKLTQRAVEQIPGRALVEINKRIGLRLLTRAGERSVSSFSRFVPVVGGVVGGTLDAVVCRMVGRTAKTLLRRADGAVLEGEVVRVD